MRDRSNNSRSRVSARPKTPFVQATLFYDRLVAVDDYIEAYKDARKAAFAEVTFLDKNGFRLLELEEIAGR